MSVTYRTLNLRGGDATSSVSKDVHSSTIRLSARQKNKAQMWERLTFNYIKKYLMKVPVATPQFKSRLQTIVGEEVSQFLEISSLTDKSLRDLEMRLQRILAQEFTQISELEASDEEKQMKKSPSKRMIGAEQLEMKPSPSKHDISNTELLNITHSRLPDINMSKN